MTVFGFGFQDTNSTLGVLAVWITRLIQKCPDWMQFASDFEQFFGAGGAGQKQFQVEVNIYPATSSGDSQCIGPVLPSYHRIVATARTNEQTDILYFREP